MSKKHKVCIVVCCLDNISPALHMDLINLTSHPSIYFQEVQVGSLLPLSRTKGVFDVPPEATHILFIDSDMKGISPDLVTALLDADKDIISPVMVQRRPPFTPAFGYFDDPDHINSHEELATKCIQLNQLVEKNNDPKNPSKVIIDKSKWVFEVKWSGLACTLIKKKVFDRLPAPWFEIRSFPDFKELEEQKKEILESSAGKSAEEIADQLIEIGIESSANNVVGEDCLFCIRAGRRGLKTWVHAGFFIEHIGQTGYHIGDFIELMNNPNLKSRMEQLTYVWQSREVCADVGS